MSDDSNVIPVGARLGSQRLYGPGRPPVKPDTAGPPTRQPAGAAVDPPAGAGGRLTEITSTVLELAGITAIAAGCWLIAPYVGLIVLGVCMVVLGVAVSWP